MADDRSEERLLVDAVRRGDQAAFMRLVDELGPLLLRVARMYVPSQAVAEEVVQETWIGVLKGIDRFEGRASLKTWIFRILTNIAKTRGGRERRSVPFSALAGAGGKEASVDPDRFFRRVTSRRAGGRWGRRRGRARRRACCPGRRGRPCSMRSRRCRRPSVR
jgi:RNA polymerase sigma-70 factor, ECF subfamily